MILTAEQRWRRFRNWQFAFGATAMGGIAVAMFLVSNHKVQQWIGLTSFVLWAIFSLFQLIRIVRFVTDHAFFEASRRSSSVEVIVGRIASVVLIAAMILFLWMVLSGRLK